MSAAVIDIGSGSVRLLLGGKKITVMTKLGEGLNATGRLSEPAMKRTVSTIKDFAQTARMAGADVYAFGTEAVRAAANRSEFLSAVASECGVRVEIISGYEEAEIALLGACPDGEATVVDIGGASVEIVCGEGNKLSYVKSLPLGMVRLTERSGGDPELMRTYATKGIFKYKGVKVSGELIGVGGTFTSLAAMALGLKKYDADKVHGYVLTLAEVKEMRDRLVEAGNPKKIAALYPVLPAMRSELITAGAIFVIELLGYLGVDGIKISDADNLDGFVRYKKLTV